MEIYAVHFRYLLVFLINLQNQSRLIFASLFDLILRQIFHLVYLVPIRVRLSSFQHKIQLIMELDIFKQFFNRQISNLFTIFDITSMLLDDHLALSIFTTRNINLIMTMIISHLFIFLLSISNFIFFVIQP